MEAARQRALVSAPVLPCQPRGPLQALFQGLCRFPHVKGSLKSSKRPRSMHVLRDGAHHVTDSWANVGKERAWGASTARGGLVGEDTRHQYLQKHPGHQFTSTTCPLSLGESLWPGPCSVSVSSYLMPTTVNS